MSKLLVFIVALFTVANASATAVASEQLECGDRVEMGTSFKICLAINKSQQEAARADIANVLSEIKAMNLWMSDWLPDTELSQVNTAAGKQPVKVRAELLQILKETLEVSRESGGALDPTFNVMFGLYNFKKGEEREATKLEIQERLPLIDWKSPTWWPVQRT